MSRSPVASRDTDASIFSNYSDRLDKPAGQMNPKES
jgi:hypothetical protein